MKQTANPMPASERQLLIRDYISDVRQTSIADIAQRFHISKNTVRRDLDAITSTASFYTVPGKGGGIRAVDGWYSSQRYLNAEQNALLQKLLPGLQPEEQSTMQSILTAFSKPTKVTKNL